MYDIISERIDLVKKEKVTAIILAAGQGKRMNADMNKQYLLLAGYPMLYYTIKAFENSNVDEIILVVGKDEIEYCKENIVEQYNFKKVHHIVVGGKERYHSVYQGLQAVRVADYVMIHDGARPFVTIDIMERTLEAAKKYGACVAGVPSKDTVKTADKLGFVKDTLERSAVWNIQTPQTFLYEKIYQAYQILFQKGELQEITDDAMIWEKVFKSKIKIVQGSYENIKITTPSDLKWGELFCK